MTYSSEVLADSPVVYYRLGDASGTTMVDSSGNGRNGTYSGSPTLGAASLVPSTTDTSVSFDGVDDAAYYNPVTSLYSTSVTAEAWINVADLSATRDIVGRRATSGGVNEQWQFRVLTSGKLDFFYTDTSGTYHTSQQSTTAISAGTTYHVAASYDGSNVRFYINGALDATVAATGTLNNNADPIRIGHSGYPSPNQELWQGRIDEVAVYATALSGTRISAHYTAGVTVPGTAASGTASLHLSASGAAGASSGATASLHLSATGATGATASGTASLHLSATGSTVAPSPASGTSSLHLSASGGARDSAAGTASLNLIATGTALATLAASGTATIHLSASGSAVMSSGGTATLTLSASGIAVALFTTDLSNALDGLDLLLTATVTLVVPVVAPPASLVPAMKYDKAIAYPTPTMVNGRPT